MDLRNTKIKAPKGEHKAIQLALFALGCSWNGGQTKVIECYGCYYIDHSLRISYSHYDSSYYNTHEYTEITKEQLMAQHPFTKADLKSGMVVEIRSGQTLLVVGGSLLTLTGGGLIISKHYGKDLKNLLNPNADIMKIYGLPFDGFKDHLNSDVSDLMTKHYKDPKICKLLWEREEVAEMTLEQVCEALGKTIKIVKG
jgi:hypothetical protein